MQLVDGRPTIGRLSADRKTLWLIKEIDEVCFNVNAPVDRLKPYLSGDQHANMKTSYEVKPGFDYIPTFRDNF